MGLNRGWWLGRQGTIDARDRYVDSAAGRVPWYVDTRALRSFLEVCWGCSWSDSYEVELCNHNLHKLGYNH